MLPRPFLSTPSIIFNADCIGTLQTESFELTQFCSLKATMLSNHKSVAIAQTIFYIPIMPVTFYILAKNWSIGARISRLTWLTLALLSLSELKSILIPLTRSATNMTQ